MDLSKLPKLSQTPEQLPAPTADLPASDPARTSAQPAQSAFCSQCGTPLKAAAQFCDSCGTQARYSAPPTSIANAWISGIFGVIFILMGKSFLSYLISLITRQPYHTGVNWQMGDLAGTEVAYPDLEGFVIWNDSGMFLFGLALFLDAAAMVVLTTHFRFRRSVAFPAFGIALLATTYNLFVVQMLFRNGIVPILSLVAVAYGGYLAVSQWGAMRGLRAAS